MNNSVAMGAHASLRASANRTGVKRCTVGGLAELLPCRLQVKGVDQSDLDGCKARGLTRRVGKAERVSAARESVLKNPFAV
jgi:hypothetical protein